MTDKEEGVVFPTSAGQRSTSEASKKLFEAVFRSTGEEKFAEDVSKERNWRYGYHKHLMRHVQTSLKTPKAAIVSSKAGLDYMHNNFEFVRDGQTYKLAEIMKKTSNDAVKFELGKIKGAHKSPSDKKFVVPYKNRELRGDALIHQLKRWSHNGTIEPDTADAIAEVVRHEKYLDLSDRYFVLLGAGAAMGPYLILLALGANIIAIDINIAAVWKRLITAAEQSSGTLLFPLKQPQANLTSKDDLYANAGCNLITQTPEIANWIKSLDTKGLPLVIGSYVYLDSDRFVKVSLACDAIMQSVCEARKDTAIAFLCTPTDIHVIPNEARKAASSNYSLSNYRNLLLLPVRILFSWKGLLSKNALPAVTADDGKEFSIVDGVVIPQGPNYILAKRLQHWRAIVARENGHVVSSNIAPSTATVSVVRNKQFSWAYDGMSFFKPVEIFGQETSNAVMGALLLHDLKNPKSYAHPENTINNPYELFKYTSFHGGVWRMGYKIGSVGQVSVLIHFIKVLKYFFLLIFLLLVWFFLLRD
eukprot:TRINITY_DN1965_c0_g1_i1.p1 TRINITY_DN1965_c0_g1~~TRINITY_DN1965_c0_g1_i1.p1  ORF type:complete len:531 (+),score=77.14 TRINITY_DN1965_c0_g1_i1:88-1680(+)